MHRGRAGVTGCVGGSLSVSTLQLLDLKYSLFARMFGFLGGDVCKGNPCVWVCILLSSSADAVGVVILEGESASQMHG